MNGGVGGGHSHCEVQKIALEWAVAVVAQNAQQLERNLAVQCPPPPAWPATIASAAKNRASAANENRPGSPSLNVSAADPTQSGRTLHIGFRGWSFC